VGVSKGKFGSLVELRWYLTKTSSAAPWSSKDGPAVGSEFELYIGNENQYFLTSFNLQLTYLVQATLVVVQALSSIYAAPLPK
jgi:hypothetical protein